MFQAVILSVISAIFLLESRVAASDSIPPYVQGYSSDTVRSRWAPVTCESAGQSYVTTTVGSKTFGRCCVDINSNCDFVTSCYGKTAYVTGAHNDDPYTCSVPGAYCIGMPIYESLSADSPVMDYWCGDDSWKGVTIYRTTTTATTAVETATTTTATPGKGATSTIASPTATNDDAAGSTSETQRSESSGSKSWIAGAVIGPIAGCAIAAGVAFWLVRRSRAKNQATGMNREMRPANELDGTSIPDKWDHSTSGSEGPRNVHSLQELPSV